MNFTFLIPIALFVCVTASIRFIVEGFVKRRILSSHASEEMLRAMLQADEQARRLSSLKWGLVLIALGLAFSAIEILQMPMETPAAIGILFAAAGLALLIFHWLAGRTGAGS